MSWIRRIVITLSEILALVMLIGAGLLGGVVGAALQRSIPTVPHDDVTAGFVAGAVTALVPAALFLALLFSLFEIAANTRETNRLLRAVLGETR